MKKALLLLMLVLPFSANAQDQTKKPPTTLRGVLLEQLRTTHNQEDWFVPANVAVSGLTAEQASWTDGKGNHSIGQLANHLIFWTCSPSRSSKARRRPSSAATTTRPSTASTLNNGTPPSNSSTRSSPTGKRPSNLPTTRS